MRLIDADEIKIKPEYMHDICGEAMIRVEDVARIINEIPSIVPQPKWILVSDRLPDKNQDVLVTIDYFERDVVMDIWEGDLFRYYGELVVAWMPFPKPWNGVDLSVLYLCDPDKNTECKKTACYRNGGECIHTAHKKYRRVE